MSESTYRINNIDFSLHFKEGDLIIKGVDEYFKPYEAQVTSKELDGHNIINSLETLYDMLSDAFQGERSNLDIKLQNKNTICLIYTISIKYVGVDSITILLNYNNDGNDNNDCNDCDSKRMALYERKIKSLEETVIDLQTKLEYVMEMTNDRKMLFYPGYIPIDIESALSLSICTRSLNGISFWFTVNESQYEVPIPNYQLKNRELNEQRGKQRRDYMYMFNKLTNIEKCTIQESDITNLKLIENCTKIKTLELYKCNELTDISCVANFKQIQIIKIIECQNIKNLYELKNIQSLNLVKTNTPQLFPNDITFVIELSGGL